MWKILVENLMCSKYGGVSRNGSNNEINSECYIAPLFCASIKL